MEKIQGSMDIKGAGIFKQAELFFDDLFLIFQIKDRYASV